MFLQPFERGTLFKYLPHVIQLNKRSVLDYIKRTCKQILSLLQLLNLLLSNIICMIWLWCLITYNSSILIPLKYRSKLARFTVYLFLLCSFEPCAFIMSQFPEWMQGDLLNSLTTHMPALQSFPLHWNCFWYFWYIIWSYVRCHSTTHWSTKCWHILKLFEVVFFFQ